MPVDEDNCPYCPSESIIFSFERNRYNFSYFFFSLFFLGNIEGVVFYNSGTNSSFLIDFEENFEDGIIIIIFLIIL